MTDHLKPCPFCGSKAYVLSHGELFSVRCPEAYCLADVRDFQRDKAVARWNSRPAEDALRQELVDLTSAAIEIQTESEAKYPALTTQLQNLTRRLSMLSW